LALSPCPIAALQTFSQPSAPPPADFPGPNRRFHLFFLLSNFRNLCSRPFLTPVANPPLSRVFPFPPFSRTDTVFFPLTACLSSSPFRAFNSLQGCMSQSLLGFYRPPQPPGHSSSASPLKQWSSPVFSQLVVFLSHPQSLHGPS